MNQLLIKNLTKTYANGTKALDNINLTIGPGVFGLLGPNGAGKSTLMRILSTLQQPDHGTVRLDDINLLEQTKGVRRLLGYLPQEFGLYPKVTAIDLLSHLAVLKGISHKNERRAIVETLLHKTNLYSHRKKRLGTFSGGMKRRFGIAQALLSSPQLLIVDEPTAGLDPGERNRFHNLLSDIAQDSIVILSTHIVEDIQELCGQMAIIAKGQVLQHGNPEELRCLLDGQVYEKYINVADMEEYFMHFNVISEKLHHGKPLIHIQSETHPGNEFEPIDSTLEDVFFHQIGLSNL
jgi:ABC-type multidrug transport system ATPase subunit